MRGKIALMTEKVRWSKTAGKVAATSALGREKGRGSSSHIKEVREIPDTNSMNQGLNRERLVAAESAVTRVA